jgi:hypothetical protein
VTNSSCNVQSMKIDGCFSDHSGGIVPINAYQIQAYKGPQLFHFDCGDQRECHYQEPEPRNQNNESTKTSQLEQVSQQTKNAGAKIPDVCQQAHHFW